MYNLEINKHCISSFLIFCVFPQKPKIKFKQNWNFLSQTSFEKAKIEKFGLQNAKLSTLSYISPNRCQNFNGRIDFKAYVQPGSSLQQFSPNATFFIGYQLISFPDSPAICKISSLVYLSNQHFQ